MSVSQLHSPSRVSVLVAAAQEAVRGAAAVPLDSVATAELGEAVQRVAELESAATALRLELSAQAEARRVAEDPDHGDAATGTDAWLAGLLGSTRASQAAGLRGCGWRGCCRPGTPRPGRRSPLGGCASTRSR